MAAVGLAMGAPVFGERYSPEIAVLTATLLAVVWTGYQTYKASAEAARAAALTAQLLELEQKPFLTVSLLQANGLRWDPEAGTIRLGASESSETVSVRCLVRSSGRSPVVLTALSRRWKVMPCGVAPPPIDPSEKDNRKDMRIPIGPDGLEFAAGFSEKAHLADPSDDLYFYGFMEFTDVTEARRYRSGFCYVMHGSRSSRGIITALPPRGGERLWYYESVPDADSRSDVCPLT
ncbi:MAG: hypothetical protein M3177_05520 [Pseudomonadota bacterium]|nr:hypothetical protein [Pseudomonadota bacterium]